MKPTFLTFAVDASLSFKCLPSNELILIIRVGSLPHAPPSPRPPPPDELDRAVRFTHEAVARLAAPSKAVPGVALPAADHAFIAGSTRPCPQCGFRISRFWGHGCHHIVCTHCKYHWCYGCGSEWGRGHVGGCNVDCREAMVAARIARNARSATAPADSDGVPSAANAACGCPPCPDCKTGAWRPAGFREV